MSKQEATSLFFYSARLLVHDYESGREVTIPTIPATAYEHIYYTWKQKQRHVAKWCACVLFLPV